MSWVKGRTRLLLGLVIAALFVLPLYWALVASLRQPGLPPSPSIEWWPAAPHWNNFIAIFRTVPLARYTLNSLLVVGAAVPLTLLTASQAGFALAQFPMRTRRFYILLSIALLITPAWAFWLFRYQVLNFLGLLDSLWALILPAFAASSPLFVLLFYWTFRSAPEEVFEAARLEGASAWTCWRLVALPLARPTMAAVAILTFVLYWSDFTSPVLYIFNPKYYTLAVGLQILKQLDVTNTPLLMAAALFMTAPILVLFVILQRLFLHNLSLANLFDRN
ncbi:MAG: carbohydrate ABC transporter permease [Anaerolineales bacterium]|nr:carbohydrate ABC transporter permease [Anaerolineales bacterium]